MHESISSNLKLIPNQLTALRLLLLPILWVLVLCNLPLYVGLGLMLALVTDAIDGPLARALNQVTQFGGKFDSLTDNLLVLSAVIWLLLLKPEVFQDHPLLLLTAISVYVTSLLVGLIKFRRFGNLHLYLSKVTGLVGSIFLIHTFLVGQYDDRLFYLAVGLFTLSSTETLLLQITRSEVDEHLGSIMLTLVRRGSPR